MLTINIPGRGEIVLSHLVLDYNGTIALDGRIIPGIAERLDALKDDLAIWVITADTHGTAARHCDGLPLTVLTHPTTEVGAIKADLVRSLSGGVVTIGNGFNDVAMSEVADLSLCVLGPEGCCGKLVGACDILVRSIPDALDLLLKPDRIRATLRT